MLLILIWINNIDNMGCTSSQAMQMKTSELEKESANKTVEINKLKKDMETLTNSLKTSQEQCTKLVGVEKQLQEEKKNNEKYKDEISNLKKSLEDSQEQCKKIKELQTEIESYANILKTNESMTNKLLSLEQKLTQTITFEHFQGISINKQLSISWPGNEIHTDSKKQNISFFSFNTNIIKPELSTTTENSFPSIEHKKLLIQLKKFQVLSLKSELEIKYCDFVSIPHLLKPQLEIEQFDGIDIPKTVESEDAQISTVVSVPHNSADLFYSVQLDSSTVFKLPVTQYLIPDTCDLKINLPKQCISEESHIFSYVPGFLFKYYAKYQSFKPTCSICSFNGLSQFWSCEKCSMLICFNCKPLIFTCPSRHSYTPTNTLKKQSCSSCQIEKVSVFINCEICQISLCEICALSQSKIKLECENSHRLSLSEGNSVCSYCNAEKSFVDCECSSLCQKCLEYLESEVFNHPGLGCENNHLLHAVEAREKCSVCEVEKEYLYYCRDCLVFVCNSCGDEYIKALYSKPLCKNMHKLQLNYSSQQKTPSNPGLRKLICTQCESTFTQKTIPAWGR